jgi:hypothetical protein
MIRWEVVGPSRRAWPKIREVRSTRKNRARQLATKMRVCWCGNKNLAHVKMKARRPHEKTSVLKMRFLDTVSAPVMRMSEKKTVGRGLKEPISPSG